jgi:general secretion pathway protein C
MAPATEDRFKLLGVVAPRSALAAQAGEGVALIAVDGVARTVRVGAAVDGDLRLLAVNARSAALGQAGVVSLNLQLTAPPPASTGALAPAAPSPTVLGGNLRPMPPQPQPQPAAPGGPPAPAVPEVDSRGQPTS